MALPLSWPAVDNAAELRAEAVGPARMVEVVGAGDGGAEEADSAVLAASGH